MTGPQKKGHLLEIPVGEEESAVPVNPLVGEPEVDPGPAVPDPPAATDS